MIEVLAGQNTPGGVCKICVNRPAPAFRLCCFTSPLPITFRMTQLVGRTVCLALLGLFATSAAEIEGSIVIKHRLTVVRPISLARN